MELGQEVQIFALKVYQKRTFNLHIELIFSLLHSFAT